jgi:hypothetical protein
MEQFNDLLSRTRQSLPSSLEEAKWKMYNLTVISLDGFWPLQMMNNGIGKELKDSLQYSFAVMAGTFSHAIQQIASTVVHHHAAITTLKESISSESLLPRTQQPQQQQQQQQQDPLSFFESFPVDLKPLPSPPKMFSLPEDHHLTGLIGDALERFQIFLNNYHALGKEMQLWYMASPLWVQVLVGLVALFAFVHLFRYFRLRRRRYLKRKWLQRKRSEIMCSGRRLSFEASGTLVSDTDKQEEKMEILRTGGGRGRFGTFGKFLLLSFIFTNCDTLSF